MKTLIKPFLLAVVVLLNLSLCQRSFGQTEQRIYFSSITPSEDTGQDYSPWLNNNLDSLVENVWQNNFKYVDVTLKLKFHSKITRLSFYDYTGVFTDKPDTIYALNGNVKTYLGLFTGETYMTFVDIRLQQPVEADAIVIHKYSNNIPQKVFVYGYPGAPTTADPQPQPVPQPPSPSAPADTSKLVKIPIDGKRWYQLNNATDGIQGLFDGNTSTTVNTGWGKTFNNYDAYYPVANGEEINLYKIKFFDGDGSLGPYPMTLSVIDSKGVRTPIATFTGDKFNAWVGPYPNRVSGGDPFKLDAPLTDIKYLVINSWYMYPNEIEFYGTYKPANPVTPATIKKHKLKQFFGVNAFEWNFEDGTNPMKIDESRMKAVKTFTQVRHYMDWQKLEPNPGRFTYAPTHSGGWNYDAIYQRCKADGIEVLADLKTLPDWMLDTYPDDQKDAENVPVKYGKDFSDPNSYYDQAKVAYQYAARYGSNSAVDTTSLVVDGSPRWTNDPVNTVKKALGLIKYIECDNERDKWWKGRKGYQTSYEYAANLSAFYDGNKNTMGPGVGVKNADPSMQVVMAGLASPDPSYVQGMIDWCKQHRGYKADGSVNLCWDVINYHLYANDSQMSQSGISTRGSAPEVSGVAQTAQKFIDMAHQYAGDMPVWVTEVGYDINQGSPYKAIAIGNKSILETQADWILRSSLIYARCGIERIFFYELYDDNVLNPIQFGSSGLINADMTRKPAADYIYQVNRLLGEYTYQETLNSDPIVDRYQLDDKVAYALVVPDEKGREAKYTLDLNGADSAMIYHPKIGKNIMDVEKVKLTNGSLNITVTETPSFVIPVGHANSTTPKDTATVSGTDFNIVLYPNPAVTAVNLSCTGLTQDGANIRVYDMISNRNYLKLHAPTVGKKISSNINVSGLPKGIYFIEVRQGGKTNVKKIIKN